MRKLCPSINALLITALINCKGIIHVGAHRGEEAPVYEWFGKKVLWFEANPYIFKDLEDNIYKYKYQKAYKTAEEENDFETDCLDRGYAACTITSAKPCRGAVSGTSCLPPLIVMNVKSLAL